MDFPFLKKETFGMRTQETFIGKECKIYLPSYFFNKNDPNAIAVELGEKIQTIGIFNFTVDDVWYELQMPLKFQFQYTERDKKRMKLRPNLPEDEYQIFILKNGDAFVYDILHKKDLDDLKEDFIGKMLENAKMPPYISYNDSYQVFLNAMSATGYTNIGVSAVNLEFLMSELYRNKKNMREPFRKTATQKNPYGYKMVRITKLPELNSTFTSLIGEDIQNQLVASILRTREGAPDIESPMEKIIKY